LLCLGLVSWPIADDIDPSIIWAQLAYNVPTATYLAYLKLSGAFSSNLLWSLCVLHAVVAVLLAGTARGEFLAARSGRANQR
jgi:hypothetical protein